MKVMEDMNNNQKLSNRNSKWLLNIQCDRQSINKSNNTKEPRHNESGPNIYAVIKDNTRLLMQ